MTLMCLGSLPVLLGCACSSVLSVRIWIDLFGQGPVAWHGQNWTMLKGADAQVPSGPFHDSQRPFHSHCVLWADASGI